MNQVGSAVNEAVEESLHRCHQNMHEQQGKDRFPSGNLLIDTIAGSKDVGKVESGNWWWREIVCVCVCGRESQRE